jgi:acylphosphatase
MSGPATRRLVWRGNVQGVGFRASVQRAATRGHVDGWVRNRTDGSVEALLVGSSDAIDAVVQSLSREWGAQISSVDSRDEPPTAVDGFRIVATVSPAPSETKW